MDCQFDHVFQTVTSLFCLGLSCLLLVQQTLRQSCWFGGSKAFLSPCAVLSFPRFLYLTLVFPFLIREMGNSLDSKQYISARITEINSSLIEYIPCYQNQCILAWAPVEATVIVLVVIDTLFQDLRSNIPQHPLEDPNLKRTKHH